MRSAKRYLFCSKKHSYQKRRKGTFFAVRSDIITKAKWELFRCYNKRKGGWGGVQSSHNSLRQTMRDETKERLHRSLAKAPIKRCVIVDDSARAHFHPNYHQLSSTIMRAVKREKLSSTIITILNMFKANDS